MAENEDIEKVEAGEGKKSLLANKKLLLIIAVTLLVIIVGLGAFFFLGSSDEPEANTDEVTDIVETNDEQTELEDLPADQMTDEEASLELPELPVEEEPQQPASASSRLAAISGGLTNPEPLLGGDEESSQTENTLDESPIELPKGIKMPEYDAPETVEQDIPNPLQLILEEFSSPEQMAAEIAKLRRQVELSMNETTRLYGELGDMEDKLREKNRIIRAQDTAYLKGPKVSPQRNSGPIAPPEPTWEVSPQHTGP
jgi:type IV secretory pathway VirB10-like protein